MESTSTNQTGLNGSATWQRWVLAAAIVLSLALAGWMIASQVIRNLAQTRQAAATAAFEEQTGIRILRVVMTAGGGVVDIQYQILNPDKALIVHDDENPPAMIDNASGLVIATPFHDHKFRELHTAVNYHELIMNGGGLLHRGSKITLIVGESKLENLIVR